MAAAQGTYVVEKIAGRPHSIKLEVVPNGMYVSLPIVPNCIYTDPEIATVASRRKLPGKKAEGALRAFLHERKWKIHHNRRGNGFIRLVFEAYSNTIVGAQMMCPRATDMIGEIATAIANGLSAEEMSFAMRAQPTYNEGIGRP